MKNQIARFGFWASITSLIGALGYIISVPLQIFGWMTPINNGYLAYGFSLIITVPYLISMISLHHVVDTEKHFFTHSAIALAIIYVTFCTLNYVVQIVTVLPAGYSWTFDNLSGTSGPLQLLNQTPHSLFWDIDALGYIFLNLSTLFASFAFEKVGIRNWTRITLQINAILTPFFVVAYFYPNFSTGILMFGLPWAVSVPACFLFLALFFRKRGLE